MEYQDKKHNVYRIEDFINDIKCQEKLYDTTNDVMSDLSRYLSDTQYFSLPKKINAVIHIIIGLKTDNAMSLVCYEIQQTGWTQTCMLDNSRADFITSGASSVYPAKEIYNTQRELNNLSLEGIKNFHERSIKSVIEVENVYIKNGLLSYSTVGGSIGHVVLPS